ncbi:transcription antitermination factor NusB [Brevibacillus ruminantium]|uniref:Transcription antitermination protein NusB n=1 Tax=Brevibacillus ruminantium TaxID=2950604 RepID=A0ABY4WD07_9BACL|nr:transcription antitermination factor NusB [Brevibacillus ruminantium]USG63640.1 transcription antitermination factor NusB [Brevibacillus ruminantium]
MKRRTAREKAVQCLFQIDMAEVDMETALTLVMEDSDEDPAYLRYLVEGALERMPRIDAEIQKYLRGWQLDRIANVDRAILRLAFFEIMFGEEIPDKVVLNEAIEIAKLFSDDQSYRYINGVLSSYLKDRQTANA